nr:YihY/virulence factor BrkB family protein [Phytoactinopolyspora alkaliphila]
MAGAASFYGFVSLFPLLLLSAAIASRVAGRTGIATIQDLVNENLPNLEIEVGRFYENAGAVGAVSFAILLFSGLRWVDSIRAAVRSMWGMDDKPGNLVVRKLLDMVSLVGLGLLLVTSWAISVLVRQMTRQLLSWLGIDGSIGTGTLELVGAGLSIAVNTLLFAYLLAGLPRIRVPAREQIITALFGAVVFEILKTFLVEYVVGAGTASSYGAFATPVIVIAWIYIVTRLLMVLAAVTAESAIDLLEREERAAEAGAPAVVVEGAMGSATAARAIVEAERDEDAGSREGNGAGGTRAGGTHAAGTRAGGARAGGARMDREAATDSAVTRARAVGVAAGAVLGVTGMGFALLLVRAFRAARELVASGRRSDRGSD